MNRIMIRVIKAYQKHISGYLQNNVQILSHLLVVCDAGVSKVRLF